MDSEALLDALYGPVKDRLESKASVVQSADFTQNGIRKHVFISNLLSTDSRECLSAHVFAWDNGKWTTETSFTHLEWRLSNWPNCKLRWLQIGHDNFGIEETRVVIDDHGGQTSYLTLYSDVPGDVSSPSSSPPSPSSSHWRPIMEVSQSIEKGETMTIDLSFKESQKPFWTVFVKTIFNHDKPLVVRYESDNHGYSAVGTVPPMTVKKAMKTRGVPVADWE